MPPLRERTDELARRLCYLRSVRSPKRLLAAVAFVAASFVAGRARADASAWFFVGGGVTSFKQTSTPFTTSGSLTIDIGVGTSPDGAVIIGALGRLQPLFTSGADVALLVRGATRGFQAGGFGVALDAGIYGRDWGSQSVGFMGDVVLGAPLGLQLTLQGSKGTDGAFGFGATLGIDLLRLTVYRQTFLDVWQNPSPAQVRKSALGRLLGSF
jgi:hypothetical protein